MDHHPGKNAEKPLTVIGTDLVPFYHCDANGTAIFDCLIAEPSLNL
jgi:hypothetical protein